MKILKINKTTFILSIISLELLFVLFSQAQTGIKIPDNGYLSVKSGTYMNIPGSVTLGNGNSGTIKFSGTNMTISGHMTLNAGSELYMTTGNLFTDTVNADNLSSVIYNGNNTEIKNWTYGNLILQGTGTMPISGTTDNPTVCRNLTINNTGNVLSVPESKALTVTDTLVNNAGTNGLVVKSSASGDGSLILNTQNVDGTINRYLTGYRWHYLSSPIDSAPISLFNTNNFMWWDASMSWSGAGDFDPWKTMNTDLENGVGYAYYFYETVIPFEGKINADDYYINLRMSASGNSDYQGWNLVGNPYSSVLDWDIAVSSGAVPAGAENAIYFFDDETGDGAQSNYRYYVPSTGGTYGIGTADANGKIPVGQGFFIKTNTDNVSLYLSKNFRTHAVQPFYKKYPEEYIKLLIEGNNYNDETIVRIVDNSTAKFDPSFDARKLFPINAQIPQIYIKSSDLKALAINSVPEIKESDIIKLGIKAEEGEYEIKLKDVNIFGKDVFLEDKEKNRYINLSEGDSYRFYYPGGVNENRFYLIFKLPSSNIDTYLSEIKIYPNPAKDFIVVDKTSDFNIRNIKIFDINGKVCGAYTDITNGRINLSGLKNGVYFIEITVSEGNVFRNCFVVNK